MKNNISAFAAATSSLHSIYMTLNNFDISQPFDSTFYYKLFQLPVACQLIAFIEFFINEG
jgi:hypothetical protein